MNFQNRQKWRRWADRFIVGGLFCLFVLLPCFSETVTTFNASVTDISAVRSDTGVQIDWRVLGGAEFAPRWRVEVRAVDRLDGTLGEAFGGETEIGREPEVVRYRATLCVADDVETIEVFLWADGLQERPATGWIVPIASAALAEKVLTTILPARLAERSVTTGERVKLVIRDTALYTVTASEVAARLEGADEVTDRNWIATTNLAVTCMDQPVAWHPVGADDGLAFVGLAYRDIYTDRNVYWISPGPGVRMPEETVALPTEPAE